MGAGRGARGAGAVAHAVTLARRVSWRSAQSRFLRQDSVRAAARLKIDAVHQVAVHGGIVGLQFDTPASAACHGLIDQPLVAQHIAPDIVGLGQVGLERNRSLAASVGLVDIGQLLKEVPEQ